ncbi:MAG: hypothetical protein EOO50_03260 [Flavobacterium sp.]|uniref:hypothetical protein n=1 Tax=Flavobacterium sp. TaxID=239 RepID=UPI0012177117|nr:hypothetical protein [Flavobacterium sp.]RZJ68118.1 MAG: hypothetical protein EOO50_03260 [Flavobacterium sp.]
MKKILLYCLVVFVLACCTAALKTSYGIKKPELETRQSISLYLQQHDVDTSKTYVFKDLMSFGKASQRKFLSFPNAYFFNEKGFAVSYPKTTENCNAKVGDFISDMTSLATLPADSTRKLSDFKELLQPKIDDSIASVNVFLTFTTYSGKLNDEKAFEWIKLLEKLKREGISVNYYLVSGDYLKSWNIPPSLQEKWGIKK